jgi:hypothetical protein
MDQDCSLFTLQNHKKNLESCWFRTFSRQDFLEGDSIPAASSERAAESRFGNSLRLQI